MQFDTMKAAREYARTQTLSTRRAHKAAPANGWRFDRLTGEYSLVPCWTVILKDVSKILTTIN
jgi:hypothetical protein